MTRRVIEVARRGISVPTSFIQVARWGIPGAR
jgi:hypothetical protein